MDFGLFCHPHIILKKILGLRRRFVCLPDRPIIKRINNTVAFEHKFEPFLNDDDFRAMITNSYDIILCDFLKKHLSPGDVFIDVGSNVGYISAIGASYVGSSGEVHGFEPLPECYARLSVLRELNPEHQFNFNNFALGEEESLISISYNPQSDSRNATLVPGKNCTKNFEVTVKRLDEYIVSHVQKPERIKVIKIDVEGFEFPVLKGLERFFSESTFRPLIVCEIKPWEIHKMGYSLEDFTRYMGNYSYHAYDMLRPTKQVDLTKLKDLEVLLFRAF